MDAELSKICFEKHDTIRIGFNSKEFEDANIEGDFKEQINQMALKKIKDDIEGRCIGEGFVIPNTVNITERGRITFPLEALQLYYSMCVNYKYTVCNPNPGVVLKCRVYTKNKIGIYGRLVSSNSPLMILIPEDLCDTPHKKEILRNAQKDDMLSVVVWRKKFEQNDKKIIVVAEIVDDEDV